MVRITRRSWTPDQIDLLLALVEKGASPARASVVLGRSAIALRNKAWQLGKPFRSLREVKADQLAREARELEAIRENRPSPSARQMERSGGNFQDSREQQ